MPTPVVFFGDLPGQPTGLARILGDLASQLHRDRDLFDVDVRVVGYAPWVDLPRTGVQRQLNGVSPWPTWVFSDMTAHGREALVTAYRSWFGDQRGVVVTCWDPSRCFSLIGHDLPVELWGYFAVDAENLNGGISGPAAVAVRAYDRVLAYTQFGARVLGTALDDNVPHLPHGIHGSVFNPVLTEAEYARALQLVGPAAQSAADGLIGCVATNQPRKDLGLFVLTLRELIGRGRQIHGWLHVDRTIGEAWSLPQLVADAGIGRQLTVTTTLTDRELASLYSLCACTIAPGRGEGFGYPIVESQACGAPAIHCDYAGGAEFTLNLVAPVTYHLVGPYALRRPILDPVAVADAVEQCLSYTTERGAVQQRVQHLAWTNLWPKWQDWFAVGLNEGRRVGRLQ